MKRGCNLDFEPGNWINCAQVKTNHRLERRNGAGPSNAPYVPHQDNRAGPSRAPYISPQENEAGLSGVLQTPPQMPSPPPTPPLPPLSSSNCCRSLNRAKSSKCCDVFFSKC